MQGRVLGIDYGEKRIGLAVSDELGLIAHGLPIVEWGTLPSVLAAIAKAASDRGVVEVVIGLPRNMDGTLGPKAEQVERFARLLRDRLKLPVVTWDERLTTVQARRLVPDDALSRK
ncbi:MAG: Holliday junction resolvase RuvX, partial [Planctomycetota bacterium]